MCLMEPAGSGAQRRRANNSVFDSPAGPEEAGF